VKTGTLDDLERHLVLEMLTSETAHVGREGENTHVKQYKGKA
jgi:hypothetical protein